MNTAVPSPAPAAASGFAASVELINEGGFEQLRPEWNALLQSSQVRSPFLTWEWLHAWWTSLGDSSALRLLAVRDKGQLIALAPFRTSRRGWPLVSSLEFLGTGYAGSDYLDLILRKGFEATGLDAIAQWLDMHRVAVRMDHLSPQSLALNLQERLRKRGWTARRSRAGICPFVDLTGQSWNSYLASRGPSHRANFKRRFSRLDREYELRFDRVTSEAERAAALAALVRYHEQRWAERGGTTAFPTAPLREFHDEATRRMLDAGWLRLYLLSLRGAPAAVMYGFAYGERFYFYQHGFDSAYAKHSAGLVLMGLTIRAAIDEGLGEFDMLYGTEPYKSLWAGEQRVLARLDLFPPHLGGRLHERRFDAEAALRAVVRHARDTNAT